MSDVVARLRALVAQDGGLLADALLAAPGSPAEAVQDDPEIAAPGDRDADVAGAAQHAVSAEDPTLALDALALRPGAAAAAGPRARGREEDFELTVEAVREGYLLHYADASRVLSTADPDLALLAGDRLYAIGLARLADAGDVASVAELADVIALSAAAHAGEDPALADAVWSAGCAALGWGADPQLDAAKQALRDGRADAADRLRAAARQLAGEMAP